METVVTMAWGNHEMGQERNPYEHSGGDHTSGHRMIRRAGGSFLEMVVRKNHGFGTMSECDTQSLRRTHSDSIRSPE